MRELQSIVDYGRGSPSIDPVFSAVADWYWSSTSFGFSENAWFVSFNDGLVSNGFGKGLRTLVRAVRNAP